MKIRVVKKGVGTELKDCGDADFEIWTVMAQEGFDNFLNSEGVKSLIGLDGSKIIEFAALEEGGKYGLGAGKAQAGAAERGTPLKLKVDRIAKQMADNQLAVQSQLANLTLSASTIDGPSTYAQYYQSSSSKMTLTNLPSATIPPKFKFKEAPPAGASEVSVVQPWWSEYIIKVSSVSSLTCTFFDGHSHPVLGSRKPDIAHLRAGYPASVSNIVLVGENKMRRESGAKEDFSDEEKGHLLDFLRELISLQPFRADREGKAFAYGYLNDGKIIQFFQLLKHRTGFQVSESPVMKLHTKGGEVLFGLLTSSLQFLGYTLPQLSVKSKPVVIDVMLGAGSDGTVYRGTLGTTLLVVKTFHREGARAAEKSILEEIAKAIETNPLPPRCILPTIVCESDDHTALLLTPEGIPFALSSEAQTHAAQRLLRGPKGADILASSEHFCLLVQILQWLHSRGLIHRDLKLSNFFGLDEEGKTSILLNDFGSAVKLGKDVVFAGAFQNAPSVCCHSFVKHQRWQEEKHGLEPVYTPHQSHDLVMVVRCIFARMCGTMYAAIAREKDPGVLDEFWKTHTAGSPWKDMMKTAELVEYDKLQTLIQALELPGS